MTVRHRIFALAFAALFSLTGCHSNTGASSAVYESIPAIIQPQAAPAMQTSQIPETTAAATEATEATEATVPAPTGLPEPEGTMAVKLYLTRKGAPRIDWEAVPGAVRYEISRSMYPDHDFSPLSSTEDLHYTNSSAPKGMTHFYQIRAFDANEVQIDTSAVLSVETKLSSWENKQLRYVSVPKVKLHTHPDSESPGIELRYMDEVKLGLAIITLDTGTWYRVYYQDVL